MEGVGEQEEPRWLVSTGDCCSGCSSGTTDSFGRCKRRKPSFSQARRFRQKPPVKIPPHEASGNPWHVLSVKSPPNFEEQWKRSDSPIPSRFRQIGCALTGCLGSNGRHLQGMTGRRSTQSEWSIGKVRQFCCLDQSLKQSSIVVGQYTLKCPQLAEQRDPFKMWRTISDGQASGRAVCHYALLIFNVRANALRFALCGRMHVPSKEDTTLIHDARQFTGQRKVNFVKKKAMWCKPAQRRTH